jgi:hypothetical protein
MPDVPHESLLLLLGIAFFDIWLVGTCFVGVFALSRGRNVCGYTLLAALTHPVIGLAVLLYLPAKRRHCPFCGERIRTEAIVCLFCGQNLASRSVGSRA